MTTVGFGEVYPRTPLGRIVATATMLSGILLIALPVAIIGRKFQEVYEDQQNQSESDARAAAAANPATPSNGAMEPSNTTPAEPKRVEVQPIGVVPVQVAEAPLIKPEPHHKPPIIPEGPTLIEMSRRLRLMKLPDIAMSSTAQELAEELEEACDMQQEISSMEREEKARRLEVVELFDGLLKRFGELLDPEVDAKKAKTASGIFGASRLTMLMFKKDNLVEGASPMTSPMLGAGAAPPLPPPLDVPPSDDQAGIGKLPVAASLSAPKDDRGKQPVGADPSQAMPPPPPLPPGMVEGA